MDPIGDNGRKVLQFTLGNIYEGLKDTLDGSYIIKDDHGNFEKFQFPFIMFKVKQNPHKVIRKHKIFGTIPKSEGIKSNHYFTKQVF
ncbi:hypothetical protein ACFRAE_08450 [Sphingobacterium sp. HJSM2_6]|uniref:hypothetical protein n=1 Tax=Sphingobacterium sp. HJSM2_6 TaxID=3366264 RepID=UPI003BE33278